MGDSNNAQRAAIACPSCGYHAGQAAAADLLYNEQLLRADYLQQEMSRLAAELRSVKRELSEAREERDRAVRQAARLLVERRAA